MARPVQFRRIEGGANRVEGAFRTSSNLSRVHEGWNRAEAAKCRRRSSESWGLRLPNAGRSKGARSAQACGWLAVRLTHL